MSPLFGHVGQYRPIPRGVGLRRKRDRGGYIPCAAYSSQRARGWPTRISTGTERHETIFGVWWLASARMIWPGPLDGGWTVSALLAHLAFWDRFVFARWEDAERRGEILPPVIDDVVQELINTAAIEQWRSMQPSVAAQSALAAAQAIDEKIERMSPTAMEAAIDAERLGLIDRSGHR